MDNFILATDSYKLTHWKQYPENTEAVYSYFESRQGATYPYTVFFGLQYILEKYMKGTVVRYEDLTEALNLASAHLGGGLFNYRGWNHILDDHNGRLPLRIKAVPEGTPVPTGNVLMTVENTCPKCFWLTNAVESLLTHVWYPSTVATLSHTTKDMMREFLEATSDDPEAALNFMLHDFGYRGASSHESAAIGGCGHLVNFLGTDTLPAMEVALRYYDANLENLAFSVPATEHSVMTSLGREGEYAQVERALESYPEGILSVVADSYDIYEFVKTMGIRYRDQILARDGRFVVRPDSVTERHKTPAELMQWIVERLYIDFGGHVNSKGYKVLNDKVRVLWGDGIDQPGIKQMLTFLKDVGLSAENCVFGMGGGLLQKVNRDTQRFAFKSSAQKRDGEWHDVFKQPLDSSKASKKGRLALVKGHGRGFPKEDYLRDGYAYATIPEESAGDANLLQTVFENGEIVKRYTLDEIRANAL